jgi:hypothetical protein
MERKERKVRLIYSTSKNDSVLNDQHGRITNVKRTILTFKPFGMNNEITIDRKNIKDMIELDPKERKFFVGIKKFLKLILN